MLTWIIWHASRPGSLLHPLLCLWEYSQSVLLPLSSNLTHSPNLKSPLKAASFSQSSLCWIIWGSAGFRVFHSVFLPRVFLPLYRFSPFKLHPCVLCGFSLPLPLYVRLREIRGLSSDGCLMRSRHARRGTEGAYEVHEAFSLAIATLHLLAHFYPKPS